MAMFLHQLPRPYQKIVTGFLISGLVGGVTYLGAYYDKFNITAETPLVVVLLGTLVSILRVVAQQLTAKYLANGNGASDQPTKPTP